MDIKKCDICKKYYEEENLQDEPLRGQDIPGNRRISQNQPENGAISYFLRPGGAAETHDGK